MTRFHIKVNPFGGVALKDRWTPAFVRSYATLDAACLAMDNIVRRNHGMPERVAITRREIREAMTVRVEAPLKTLTGVEVNRISSQAGLASFRGGAL